ncbi:LON peptidase substrate-binding domain-containing protein [Opitutia bacterium ISCC 51]|nr:LON peptidase substrate-binding domain-containing protein [Opitutae bacterium ISCC 51]QXD29031.1 LON peptidase substrate-binding domain-containing protein [Opitutae bacterium ISCC 52]
MRLEIELPDRVPVMTLPEVVFFPKVMMPLFIFEPRYRTMLKTSLEGNRMFAVAGIDPSQVDNFPIQEPAHSVATIGLIRGCKTQEDGTSHLILQGLSRIRLDELFEDKPYREAAITPLKSSQETDELELTELRDELLEVVKAYVEEDSEVPGELLQFVEEMKDPEDFVDLVAYTFVPDPVLKQHVLETLKVEARFEILIEALS